MKGLVILIACQFLLSALVLLQKEHTDSLDPEEVWHGRSYQLESLWRIFWIVSLCLIFIAGAML